MSRTGDANRTKRQGNTKDELRTGRAEDEEPTGCGHKSARGVEETQVWRRVYIRNFNGRQVGRRRAEQHTNQDRSARQGLAGK